jgi:hypothetical protein
MAFRPTLARRRAVIVCNASRRLPAFLRARGNKNDPKARELIDQLLASISRPAPEFQRLSPEDVAAIFRRVGSIRLTMATAVRVAAELSVSCAAFGDARDPEAPDPIGAVVARFQEALDQCYDVAWSRSLVAHEVAAQEDAFRTAHESANLVKSFASVRALMDRLWLRRPEFFGAGFDTVYLPLTAERPGLDERERVIAVSAEISAARDVYGDKGRDLAAVREAFRSALDQRPPGYKPAEDTQLVV